MAQEQAVSVDRGALADYIHIHVEDILYHAGISINGYDVQAVAVDCHDPDSDIYCLTIYMQTIMISIKVRVKENGIDVIEAQVEPMVSGIVKTLAEIGALLDYRV